VAEWIDFVDPTADDVLEVVGAHLPEVLVEQLSAPPDSGRRPRLSGAHGWIAGTLQVPLLIEAEDRLYHQELGLVVTPERVVTVRKTVPGAGAFDTGGVREVYAAQPSLSSGRIAHHLLDEVAERYLDVEDSLNAELDELDDHMDEWRPERIRRRIADLRRDILEIRRTLGPTRDAVRRGEARMVDDELRPFLVEVYDKLLHASEALDLARDLVASAREQHHARIAQEQNDVIRKLTVIASLLLLPTFIVGNYGQNFTNIPELDWRLGYAFSWALIVVTTAAQLAFYRWRRWI
jgi:magnesium transporter